jgi:hypothetical protein
MDCCALRSPASGFNSQFLEIQFLRCPEGIAYSRHRAVHPRHQCRGFSRWLSKATFWASLEGILVEGVICAPSPVVHFVGVDPRHLRGTVVEVSLIPIKYGHYAETPEARREVEESQRPETLKGWKRISEFLGEPVSVVKRWAAEGMPVHREGPFVATSSNELDGWLGQESGKPVHVATEDTDLTAELKRGLSFVRREKPQKHEKKQSALPRKATP